MKLLIKYSKIILNLIVFFISLYIVFIVAPKIVLYFMPFVIGWIIALIANPLVRFLEKKMKIVRKHSSMIIIIVVLAMIITIGYVTFANLFTQGVKLAQNIPNLYSTLEDDFIDIQKNFEVVYNKFPDDVKKTISDITKNLSTYFGGIVPKIGAPTMEVAGNIARNVPGTLVNIVMIILSSYFFTAQHDIILKNLKKYTSNGVQEKIVLVINDLKSVVGGYFKAQFKIMIVVYILLVIGLLILKVDYAILLSLLIAFLDMLPIFGTGTILFPWAVFKLLSGDYTFAVGLIVIYIVTQVVRQLIQPKIVGDSIGVNPLTALFFMFIGYKMSGFGGMIIAVPIGMIIINFYKAGVFDTPKNCIKELVNDINQFRKM